MSAPRIHGLMAEFSSSADLLQAIRGCREAGYRRMDAYTPYPIEKVCEELGHHRSRLPLIVLLGGILGCLTGFFFQYWTSVIAYPMNVGGRPLNSWVSFIPVTFEVTVLFASGAAVLGMLLLNGLPSPYHPVFNVERFALASRDRYFLCIEATDPRFDPERTRELLDGFGSTGVWEVEE